MLSRKRVILKAFQVYLEIGKQRGGCFRSGCVGELVEWARRQALSHRSSSVLPSGPTTGMGLPPRQVVVFVGQDISLLNRQMLKHFYSFSFSTFMLYQSHLPTVLSVFFSESLSTWLEPGDAGEAVRCPS